MTPNPSTLSPSQPTIHTFFTRTSSVVRQSASSVFEMTPAPTQRRARRSELASSSSEEEDDGMDLSENRKRSRPNDTITGEDVQGSSQSASMIANTSIMENTGAVRRRRISSDLEPTHSEHTSTPQRQDTPARILAQMEMIRDEIIPDEHLPQASSNVIINHTDHSNVSEENNLSNMVAGVVAMTRATANMIEPTASSLTWDDMNIPSLPMISPRPVPTIPEAEDEDSSSDVLSPQEESHVEDTESGQQSNTNNDITSNLATMQSLRDMVQENFRAAYETLEVKILESISQYNAQTTRQVEENKEAIVVQYQAVGVVNARVDNIEQDQERHQFELNELQQQLDTQEGHVNRLDEALATVHPDIQSLMSRIVALEANLQQNEESNEMLKRLKRQAQREDDAYFMKTISVHGFSAQIIANNQRDSARAIMRIIGSEDIISYTSKITFNSDRTKMRLTFHYHNDFRNATHRMSAAIKQIKDSGHNAGIGFNTITPPRFSKERDILYKIATEMKAQGTITRFYFVIIKNSLCLKVARPGESDTLINVPTEDNDMEVSENGGTRCPICLGDFDNSIDIAVYHCGHTFHTPCLKSSLAVKMNCPTCRAVPDDAHIDQITCTRCVEDMNDPNMLLSTDLYVVARKCSHMHLRRCQTTYLDTLQTIYPQTLDGYNDIIHDPEVHGCFACQRHQPQIFNANCLMHDVAFTPGMTDFTELGAGGLPVPPRIPTPPPPSFLTGANRVRPDSQRRQRRRSGHRNW